MVVFIVLIKIENPTNAAPAVKGLTLESPIQVNYSKNSIVRQPVFINKTICGHLELKITLEIPA